jgi:hypothetical protein
MSITYTAGQCEVHTGPSHLDEGVALVLVLGPEPNAVCQQFRQEAYEQFPWASQMYCPRPVLTDDGQWAVLGRVW